MVHLIQDWFFNQQQQSTLETAVVPLSDSQFWDLTTDGKIGGRVGTGMRFYEGKIVSYSRAGVLIYENLMLESTSKQRFQGKKVHGLVLLARYHDKYLVQAKAEPGNNTPGKMVLTSTIQSNYQALPKVPYVELTLKNSVFTFAAPQDAGMLYNKNNEFRLVELDFEPAIHSNNFRLSTLDEIAELQAQNLVGDHLTQILGHVFLHQSRKLD